MTFTRERPTTIVKPLIIVGVLLLLVRTRLFVFLLVTYVAGGLVLGGALGLGLSLLLGKRFWFAARHVFEPYVTLEGADDQPASEEELSSFYMRWANRWFISGCQAFATGGVAAYYQARWPSPEGWMASVWQGGWLLLAVTLRGFTPALAIPAVLGFWLAKKCVGF